MTFIMSSCLGQVVKDRTWHIIAWHPIAMIVTSSMRLDKGFSSTIFYGHTLNFIKVVIIFAIAFVIIFSTHL